MVVVGHAWLLKAGSIERELLDREVYTAILAYLNSSTAYDLIEYLSPQIAGGQLDLSNKYLGRMPIPNFSVLAPESLAELIMTGTCPPEIRPAEM